MPGDDKRTSWDRLELWSAALLAAATLATAFSAYESTRWGGQQATRFTEAGADRTESAKAQNRGSSLVTIDVSLFAEYAGAVTYRNEELRRALEKRFFRDEFKPAFHAWLDLNPLRNEAAPNTPFEMPQYRVQGLIESERLEQQAEAKFKEGREANQTSDKYVLATIFFAAVLFFGGLSVKFRSTRLVVATLVFGTLMYVAGIVRLLTLPFL